MKKRDEISNKILDHLRKTSGSGDTLSGIAWSIASQIVVQTVDEVADAMEDLLRAGLVKRQNDRYWLAEKNLKKANWGINIKS